MRTRKGFTVTELLVVVGILVLLAAILLPSLVRARRAAARTRVAMDMQTIGTALEEYKNRVGDYPRPAAPDTGATLLVTWLVAPADTDGKAGPGFRQSRGPGNFYGQPIGPLVNPDRLPIIGGVFVDGNDRPILYYPAARKQPDLSKNDSDVVIGDFTRPQVAGYVGNVPTYQSNVVQQTMYNHADNNGRLTDLTTFRVMLGDKNANGGIDAGEQPVTLPYLLWAAGTDGFYGTEDDVTSFR